METKQTAESAGLTIEVGKEYRTRGGWKATVEKLFSGGFDVRHHKEMGGSWYHLPDGRWNGDDVGFRGHDLVSLWEAPAVDLSKAKAGDTVKFRCGGEAVVRKALGTGGDAIELEFEGFVDGGWVYDREGFFDDSGLIKNQPFDVIAIEPKAFDWKDVKPGMAFEHRSKGDILWYIGPCISKVRPDVVFMQTDPKYTSAFGMTSTSKADLVRAPEHDITPESVGV